MKRPRLRALVVDASVAVKLFVAEENSDQAEEVFSLPAGDLPVPLVVPELFFIECANVFRTRFKLRDMTAKDAQRALAILQAMPLQSLSLAELSADALDLALQYDLSVYDACYLAAAVYLQTPLLTADKKLAGKMAGTDYQVIWLGDWQ